nr:alpha-tocopherol transfer protein-like [Onthophagus taurus]
MIIEKYKDQIEILRGWLQINQHLPQNIDDQNLSKFLFSSDYSIEKAKNLMEICFRLRRDMPEIFSNRDPKNEEIQNIFGTVDYLPLPVLTKEKYKLFLYRLRDPNPDRFVYADSLKAFFMVADLRMYTDFEESEGEIPIFDMAGMSLKHITKVNLSILRKYMTYTQEAHPVRLRAIHVVNVPTFLDKCVSLVKPFIKSDVSQLIHYHTPNSNTLNDFIPKELLPIQYGGSLCDINDLAAKWREKIMENRDFFLDKSRWEINEAKLKTKSDKFGGDNGNYGVVGSFRTLNID